MIRSRSLLFRTFILLAIVASAAVSSLAQQPVTGLPPFGSFGGGPFDTVNSANLNVHFVIPVFSRPGRGLPLSYNLTYDSLIWEPVTSNNRTSWQPTPNSWGWTAQTTALTGSVTYGTVTFTLLCNDLGSQTVYGGWVYNDPSGGLHPFNGTVTVVKQPASCGSSYTTPLTATATDNSGYILNTDILSGDTPTSTVYTPSGLQIAIPADTVTDANSNQLSLSGGVITDTLGTALTMAGSPSSGPVTYSYSAPGGAAKVTVNYSSYWVQTCFGVSIGSSSIGEYPATPNQYLVSSIELPDTSTYQFTYEATTSFGNCTAHSGAVTGRIASVTLPTGGKITYSYSNSECSGNPSNCIMTDGSPSNLTRQLTDGTNIIDQPGTWTYMRGLQSGGLPQTTTSITDPGGNLTSFLFSGIYETDRKTYQGSSTLLDHSYICYVNGEQHALCSNATVQTTQPITFRAFIDYPGGGSIDSEIDTFYDPTYGFVTGSKVWDFTGTPLQVTSITYNSSLCSSKNLCAYVQAAEVEDGKNNQVGLTNSYYDGNGNLTEVSRWVSGSNYLNQYYSYDNTNYYTLKTSTDPNGTITSYNGGGYACSGAFPIQVSVDGLTTTYGYNCTGGVATSIKDTNNATTTISYNDPYFWRPASTTDPYPATTYFNYYLVNNSGNSAVTAVGQAESVMEFGNSVIDQLATTDAFGRPALSQAREAPNSSTWDTVEYLYNPNGLVSYATFPFAGSAGTAQGDLPANSYSYDALNRYVDIEQPTWTNLDIHYTYNLNDVQVTVNSPPGDTAKSRQYQYDAMRRLTSVCEITTMTGSGACSQNTSKTGFYTSYAYNPLGGLTGVSQSGQGRSYSYDGLGRMISETNPESGTTTYKYDSVAGSYCAVTSGYSSPGDLVAKADADGNHICYWYDVLHRLTDVGNNNQSSTNPCLRFRYDNSTGVKGAYPSGISPTNYYGRMVEAATDNCGSQSDPLLTDEWFSYASRGDQSDAWELTPNSGGYYHLVNQYLATGAVSTRNAYLGTGTGTPFSNSFAYGFDGKGRPNSLEDLTLPAWIWQSVSNEYNPADQPLNVLFSSGDSEQFGWNTFGNCTPPNCNGLMSSWTSTVGTTSGSNQQTGSLTWNSNGTLQQLTLTDQLNSANTQMCTYLYDDLARLSGGSSQPGVNCANVSGNVWQQTFTYDEFGNIQKSGNLSFLPNYNNNNQISNLGFQYHGDGNIVNDGTYTYTYSVYMRPAAVGSNTATYDAFLRLVEVNGSTQMVYAPDGFKFAYMNGQAVQQYMASMGGGVQAVYTAATPAGPAFWRHSDWLGTERLASTPSRGVYFDGGWAPFGETYAGMGAHDRSFTGQTSDITGSAYYEFPFREYSSTQGRWLVPDLAGMAAVDIFNPQTWNRYAYVGNSPLSNVDPLGLHWVCYNRPNTEPCPTSDLTGGGYGAPGSYDMSVVGPGNDGFGGLAPIGQFQFGNGATFQIDGSGNWYNVSAAEELSTASAAELGLPDPSNFYGPSSSSFLGQNNGILPPGASPQAQAARALTRPRILPNRPNLIPGNGEPPPQLIRPTPTGGGIGGADANLPDAAWAENATWEQRLAIAILVVLQDVESISVGGVMYLPPNPANQFHNSCPPGGC